MSDHAQEIKSLLNKFWEGKEAHISTPQAQALSKAIELMENNKPISQREAYQRGYWACQNRMIEAVEELLIAAEKDCNTFGGRNQGRDMARQSWAAIQIVLTKLKQIAGVKS